VTKLLVVDDEESICWGISRLGQRLGYRVFCASSAEDAISIAEEQRPDIVVLDVRLPGMDGISAIDAIREYVSESPIIVMTAYGDLQTAVAAVRKGAVEYLIKPFGLDEMERVLARAVETRQRTSDPQREPIALDGFVGSTGAMQEVFKRIALAAASDATVLLCGESGTGKELAARAIHKYGPRSRGPFVAVNIASLNPALTESELFGHLRGAFTDAAENRTGLLVQADGGTLFLDEVADIPIAAQVKLLRAVEQREVTPVGGGQLVRTEFRLICATHQPLWEKVQAGLFRHDLYFRLAAFPIQLPPLRDRREDIVPLAEYFCGLLAGNEKTIATISADAQEELQDREWTGNVRELRNAIEHALVLSRGGMILRDHLPPPSPRLGVSTGQASISPETDITNLIYRWTISRISQSGESATLHEDLLRLVEPPMLKAILEKCHGQCAVAARVLGLHRTTLRKKLEEYGIALD
jgi:two-component system nitrogen regulation response regulator GlnG